MQHPVLIRTNFDPSLDRWVATSTDVKGLSLTASSICDLKKQLPRALYKCLLDDDSNHYQKADLDRAFVNYQIVLGSARHAPMNILVQRNIRLIAQDEAIEVPTVIEADIDQSQSWWSALRELYQKMRSQKEHASPAFGYGALSKSNG